MSGKKVKVAVLEEDGVEILEPTELLLTGEVIDIDDTEIGSGSDDLQSVMNFVAKKPRNLDGGFANSVYLPTQCFDGGNASG